MPEESKKRQCQKLFKQLQSERSFIEPTWHDIGDYILPWKPRWNAASSTGQEDPLDMDSIIDSTATFAMRTLSSGLMSGLTSPARKWLSLELDNAAEEMFPETSDWLWLASETLLDIFSASNFYKILPSVYEDLGGFGTAPMGVFEDSERVVRFEHYPPGSYYVGLGHHGRVQVWGAEFSITVRQLVDDYARMPNGEIDTSLLNKLSEKAQSMWRNGNTERRVNVVQVVKANPDYDPRSPLAKHKRFASYHYEQSGGGDDNLLKESGFDFFPVPTARWQVSGNCAYGTGCPGMIVLGDVKQLQTGEYRSLQAIEKKVSPAMVASVGMRNQNISLVPNGITYENGVGREGLRPAYVPDFSISELEHKQEQVRQRIKIGCFENLFLMLAGRAGDQPLTATEVNELREEKLFALGPVLERVDEDLIDPIVEITLELAIRQGRIPPPPEEEGPVDYKIEKKSVVAQAQSAFGLGKVERFGNFVGQSAQMFPQVLDKVNSDRVLEVYANDLGVPPDFLFDQEHVNAVRQQRAEQQAQASQAQGIGELAAAAKNLSGADLGGNNALAAIAGGDET